MFFITLTFEGAPAPDCIPVVMFRQDDRVAMRGTFNLLECNCACRNARSWASYWESWFIPEGTESGQTTRFVEDVTLPHVRLGQHIPRCSCFLPMLDPKLRCTAVAHSAMLCLGGYALREHRSAYSRRVCHTHCIWNATARTHSRALAGCRTAIIQPCGKRCADACAGHVAVHCRAKCMLLRQCKRHCQCCAAPRSAAPELLSTVVTCARHGGSTESSLSPQAAGG